MLIRGAVLTGGRSARFGSDKALAEVSSGVLTGVVVQALRGAGVDPIVLIGGDPEVSAATNVPMIQDRWPGEGPLAALATALQWGNAPRDAGGWVAVMPCDLPLVSASTVERLMTGLAPETAAVAALSGEPHPIMGIWPVSWADAAVKAVRGGARKMQDALALGPWIPVEMPLTEAADADTPEALKKLIN